MTSRSDKTYSFSRSEASSAASAERLAAGSANLDELDRFAAWTLDHQGARRPEPIDRLEEFDLLACQLVGPGVEILDGQRDMILQLPARGDQRLVALVGVPHHRHVAEFDAGAGRAEHPFAIERGPSAVGTARRSAVGSDHRGRRITGPHRRMEMFLIPFERGDRVLLIKMDMVEALRRMVAGIFDERP